MKKRVFSSVLALVMLLSVCVPGFAAEEPETAPAEAEVTEAPAPEVEEVPAPEVEEVPAPEVEEAPAPEIEEAPAPEAEEAPAPEAEEAPAPEVEEAPAPEVEEAPAPEVEEVPAPEAEEAPEGEPDPALLNPDRYLDNAPTSGVTGETSSITWSISGSTLTFTGTGRMGWDDSVEDEDYAPYGWRYFTEDITAIVVGEGITYIESLGSFENLQSITLPSTLTEIGSWFFECDAPIALTIPAGVTKLPHSIGFVSSVTVDPANKNYSSKNGMLFDKAGTTLLYVPQGQYGACTVPEGTTTLGSYSIGYNVSAVQLPSTLTNIENEAISPTLDSLVVPASVTHIGAGAIFMSTNGVITVLNPNCKLDDYAIQGYIDYDGSEDYTNTLFRGYAGSTLEQYAKDMGYKFESLGQAPGTLPTQAGAWQQSGGQWYYINTDGSKAKGLVSDNGKLYYLNADGVMQTGWIKIDSSETRWVGDDYQVVPYSYYYYANSDGSLVVNGWVQDGGKWYWLDSEGVMAQGRSNTYNGITNYAPSHCYINGDWYLFDASGAMYANGWVQVDYTGYVTKPVYDENGHWDHDEKLFQHTSTSWYYAKPSGALYADEWAKIGGKWYYFNEYGTMCSSDAESTYDIDAGAWEAYDTFVFDDGCWYYMDNSGAMATGWVYLKANGRTNCIGNADGTPVDDQAYDYFYDAVKEGGWYFFDGSGAMQTGWQKIGGVWYYMDPVTGLMQTGWLNEGGSSYFLSDSGAMKTGWIQLDNEWYWADPSGAIVKNDWRKVGGVWYWLTEDGAMAIGRLEVGGQSYYLDNSGAMQIGWIDLGGGDWYYATSSGALAKNTWVKSGGKDYYLKADGLMARNETTPDGYTVDDAGVWVK